MYDHKEMKFLTSDLNNFVQLSTSMATECSEIANQLGYDIETTTFPFLAGGTDAAEFSIPIFEMNSGMSNGILLPRWNGWLE